MSEGRRPTISRRARSATKPKTGNTRAIECMFCYVHKLWS